MKKTVPPQPCEQGRALIERSPSEYKNSVKSCYFCHNSHGAKKWKIVLRGNRVAYCCAMCRDQHGGTAEVMEALDRVLPYNLPNIQAPEATL